MKTFTAWISKYALGSGVLKVEVECAEFGGMSYSSGGCKIAVYEHEEGVVWHKSAEEAVARAEKLLASQIQSLTKRLNRLKSLKIEAPP